MADHEARVQVKEYHVNAFPNSDSPNARLFLVRVVRFDEQPDETAWGVFDSFGLDGHCRLGPDGGWSLPPNDDEERQRWRAERRYSEERALELARAAAPHMVANGLTISDMLAWEAGRG